MVKDIVSIKKTLMESIEAVLGELGNSSKKSILFAMQKKGIWKEPESFNMDEFARVASELLAKGADIVMERIFRHFSTSIDLDFELEPELSSLEKIKKILNMTESDNENVTH